ncbi:MAG TPA: winged helix DNA-binding domain-containing protein [Candidatus Saccharimonadales bacterium]|nr:winged helix DNA-binding domain-containing protein [Candidatus Saccharimonadales bacterium]
MTTKDIANLRIVNQHIARPHLTDPADVVRSMGAIQAQDYGQSLWAVGLRTKGAKVGNILGAIESGKILRTWPMRGTIHWVPAEDAKWMVALNGERTISSARSRHVEMSLDDNVFARAEELLRRELEGGKRLSRPKIRDLLAANKFDVGEQRVGHILGALSLRGVLCIGPMEGKQQTFVLLDEWAPKPRNLTREEGLGELARRYFTSHGPATILDFATWASLAQRDAKIGLEIAKPHLVTVNVEGADYWLSRDAQDVDPAASKGVHLLAAFEEYLLGYKDRTAVVTPDRAVASYTNGIFYPLIVVDGQVVGTWKRTVGAKNIAVAFTPFEPLSAAVIKQVHAQAERYGEFMGQPIVFAP